MEEQTQSVPTLCTAGCGYFGNSATDGLCSKCFRDQQRRKHAQATGSSASRSSPYSEPREETDSQVLTPACSLAMGGSNLNATPLSDLPASSTAMSTIALEQGSPEVTKTTPKKNRCFSCRKKVGLTGFHCRCGHQFCALHRYADKHNCPFDYKTAGREELERKHPRIVADKVQKL